MSDKLRGYAHRVDVLSDVRRVWSALVDPISLSRWCSPKAQIRAQPGGLFRASVDRVIELEAHIDVFEPGRRLRLIYLPTSELPPADSAIVDDFILDATTLVHQEPETIVRLLGSGIPSTPDWDAQYRRLRMGWQAAMTRVKVVVERQMGEGQEGGPSGPGGL